MMKITVLATLRTAVYAFTFVTINGFFFNNPVFANTYWLNPNSNMVGSLVTYTTKWGDTLPTVGRRHSIGGEEMAIANPGLDYWQPGVNKKLLIPSRFILPQAEYKGIVVNLAEMRLYYFHPNEPKVSTYPVAIGKSGWQTPMGKTTITKKRSNPTWVVPQSIIEDRKRGGLPVVTVMPPGPKNPLGKYAMNTGFKNIVIHGTPWPLGVGLKTSHGCIRMMPEHIEELFQMVEIGTPVNFMYQAVKVGYDKDTLYLETHPDIIDYQPSDSKRIFNQITSLQQQIAVRFLVKWSNITRALEINKGIPIKIGEVIRQKLANTGLN